MFAPPPRLSVTEWAERHRILSTESSSTTGKYRVAEAPYQRGMQDAVKLPGVEEVVLWTAAQMGKSTVEENIFSYFACEDPCPIIWMWPTDKVAKEWSSDTLDPLLRDSPEVARVFAEGARKSSNRGLFKKFPGGYLAIIGANAPSGLRRRRARLLICDEIDANPVSAGDEGNPVEIVISRSETFWNAVRIMASTCTEKDESAIEGRYSISNRQKYWLPCPHCQEMQVLSFRRLMWPKDEEPNVENTVYPCEGCGAALTEMDKAGMNARGTWIAEHPEIVKIQGFWINKMNSQWVAWHTLAAKFKRLNARMNEDREALKPFINLDLAETWQTSDEKPDREGLVKRCEKYRILSEVEGRLLQVGKLPDPVTVITCAVDVQPDRLVLELVGWGKNRESWSLDWRTLEGECTKPDVWTKLDAYLAMEFVHARDVKLPIAATFVDSGFAAHEVYGFTKPRASRWIYASKGASDFNAVPLAKKKRIDRSNVWLFMVGSSQIKKTIYNWLRNAAPGPGYMHFSDAHNDAEYFNQLTAETLKAYYERGFPKRRWEKAPGARNEALDVRVYNYAAFLSLSEQPDKLLDRLRADLVEEARNLAEQRKAKNDPEQLDLLDADLPIAESVAAVVEAVVERINAVPIPPPTPQLPPQPPEAPQQKIRIRRGNWL